MDILWNDPESTLTKWKTPLIENENIVELPVDQRTITRRCTDKTISFIKKNKDKPFFVYVPHSMPHIPLYVPDEILPNKYAHVYVPNAILACRYAPFYVADAFCNGNMLISMFR